MKKNSISLFLAVFLSACGAQPVFAVSREILQIMNQLDSLQQMVQNLQKTVDTQRGELRTLIEQTNDSVNSMKSVIAELQKESGQNLAASNSRLDSLTSQVQALSESLEEAKSRLAKLSDQMAQTQNIIQTLNASAAQSTTKPPTGPGGDSPPQQPSAPDPDTLYKSGLSYYNGGQYQLAIQAFQDYLKYYSDTDLASNAQFYIGDCYYSQGNYPQAITEYNKCLERYPNGNKLPAAQLKKGYALIELGQKQAGVRELRSLVQRYPNSHEAELARQRLRKLGITLPVRHGE